MINECVGIGPIHALQDSTMRLFCKNYDAVIPKVALFETRRVLSLIYKIVGTNFCSLVFIAFKETVVFRIILSLYVYVSN